MAKEGMEVQEETISIKKLNPLEQF